VRLCGVTVAQGGGAAIADVPDGVAGDADAQVAALFERLYPSLVGSARLLLDDTALAEDVVQEAFVRVRVAWWRIRQSDRAAAYVRSAVVNLARSGLRRRAVARRREPEQARAHPLVAPAAEDAAVSGSDRDAVARAVRALPRRQRECVVLRYYLDLSEADTAAALGITAGAVKTHVHRALAALAAELEELR
jgi:RNA polymerase sigma-70 factor (sigma-E family)